MTNEYGVKLDRNGYAPSIMQDDLSVCYFDGLSGDGGLNKLDRHEAFGGAYRAKSKRLGLWMMLHHDMCHQNGPQAVHNSAVAALEVKRAAQLAAMRQYGWTVEQFIQEFGKNYLEVQP